MKSKPETKHERFPRKLHICVTQADIKTGLDCNPRHCMIKLATSRAIRVPHGYVHVDATGISITRRIDYREKAFMPRRALAQMLRIDNGETVKPFNFWVEFHPHGRIRKRDKEKVNAVRRVRNAALRAQGKKPKTYSLRKRLIGVAMTKVGNK
jgi:hypothetical protein